MASSPPRLVKTVFPHPSLRHLCPCLLARTFHAPLQVSLPDIHPTQTCVICRWVLLEVQPHEISEHNEILFIYCTVSVRIYVFIFDVLSRNKLRSYKKNPRNRVDFMGFVSLYAIQ